MTTPAQNLVSDILNDCVEIRLGNMMQLIKMTSAMVQTLEAINHPEASAFRQQFRQWDSHCPKTKTQP
jgi:hypothetical protein